MSMSIHLMLFQGCFPFNTLMNEWSYFETTAVTAKTRPTLFLWPFSSDMWLCYTGTISALLFLSFLFFSALVGWVGLCACRLAALSHVYHPWRRCKPVPKSLRRICLGPLSLSLAGVALWNDNKLKGLPTVYAFAEVKVVFHNALGILRIVSSESGYFLVMHCCCCCIWVKCFLAANGGPTIWWDLKKKKAITSKQLSIIIFHISNVK